MSEHADSGEIPEARRKRSWWPGLIWAVPVAVLIIVAWLGIRALTGQGPEVTVTFAHAAGVKAGNTDVKYDGMNVGTVESVDVAEDLSKVTLTLRLDPIMRGHLGKGTRFWLAGESFSFSDPASVKAIISGPYVGIDPVSGPKVARFDGLEQPPVLKGNPQGLPLTLQAATLGTVQRGTPIYFRSQKVGEITNVTFNAKARAMTAEAFIDQPYRGLINRDTRFWNASAIEVSTAGSGPSVQFQSVPALFEGAVKLDDFGRIGPPAQSGEDFTLFAGRSDAEAATEPEEVRYAVVFPPAAGGLAPGDPVTLAQVPVGYVREAALDYDQATGDLATRAVIGLRTDRIRLGGGAGWAADPKPQMDAMLRSLIARGLRAELGKSVPLVGGSQIELAMLPSPPPASLGGGDVPEIPTSGSAGIAGVIASANDVMHKLDAMPLDQIAGNIHDATSRLAALSRSPELTDALRRLDRTVAHAERISESASAEIGPLLAQLHQAVGEADLALAATRRLAQGENSGPESAGLPQTLYELSRAARSLRELSNYLGQHPNALLTGKAS